MTWYGAHLRNTTDGISFAASRLAIGQHRLELWKRYATPAAVAGGGRRGATCRARRTRYKSLNALFQKPGGTMYRPVSHSQTRNDCSVMAALSLGFAVQWKSATLPP